MTHNSKMWYIVRGWMFLLIESCLSSVLEFLYLRVQSYHKTNILFSKFGIEFSWHFKAKCAFQFSQIVEPEYLKSELRL